MHIPKPNEYNICTEFYTQSNHKWYAFELNSKFDKTFTILLKSFITISLLKGLNIDLRDLLFH
jgi:hypothetical protein